MFSLVPAWLRGWRCRGCGARHDWLWSICPYTELPREGL